MTLVRVRLELAREPDHPVGSPLNGYEFIAPVDKRSMLDVEEWRERRKDCTVRRVWEDEDDLHGHLTHNGDHWKFHYDGTDPDEDEPIFKLSTHALLPQDYLSITEQDGEQHTFRIVHVTELPPKA